MFELKPIILSIFLFSVSVLPAHSDGLELPGEVTFGTALSDLQTTAETQGWGLRQTTFSSNAWSSDTEGVTFYFCDQVLSSVDQYLDGGLRTFVETVWKLELEYGKAATKIFVLAPRSDLEMHGVGSVFEPSPGKSISVQLQTKNDTETVWTRKSDSNVCKD